MAEMSDKPKGVRDSQSEEGPRPSTPATPIDQLQQQQLSSSPPPPSQKHNNEGTKSNGNSTASCAEVVTVPLQNIRSFKETVVNTSRLLRVFNKQQRDLSLTQDELAKLREEAQRLQKLNAAAQNELEAKEQSCREARAEIESTKRLLEQREKELATARGIREDLEIKLSELQQQATVAQKEKPVPRPSPAASYLNSEIERLREEITRRDGTIRSLRFQFDRAKSNAKGEVIALQVKLDQSLAEAQSKFDKELEKLRDEIAKAKEDVVREQERCIELEMESGMKQGQIEDLETQIKNANKQIEQLEQMLQTTKTKLKEEHKEKAQALRQTITQKQKEITKKDRTIQDLLNQLEKLSQKAVPVPDHAQLLERIAQLEQESRDYFEIAKSYQVELEEIKREQPLEKRKPRGKLAAIQQEVEDLKVKLHDKEEELAVTKKALDALRASSASKDRVLPVDQIIEVEDLKQQIEKRDTIIEKLQREVNRLKEEDLHTMKLRNASSTSRTRSTPTPSVDNELAQRFQQEAVHLRKERAALLDLIAEQQLQIREYQLVTKSWKATPLRSALETSSSENIRSIIANQQPTDSSGPSPLLMADSAGARLKRVLDSNQPTQSHKPKRSRGAGSELNTPTTSTLPAMLVDINSTPTQPRRRAPNSLKDSASSSRQLPGSMATKQVSMLVIIKRQLHDKRMNDTSRARHFLDHLQSHPASLMAALQQMHRPILDIDPEVFVITLESALKKATAAVKSADNNVPSQLQQQQQQQDRAELVPHHLIDPNSPEDTDTDSALPGVVVTASPPRGIPGIERDMALSLWNCAFKQGKADWVESVIKVIGKRVIINPEKSNLDIPCALVRIFAAFCLLSRDILRARVFCVDLLTEAVDRPHVLPVMANIAAVWPEVLSKNYNDNDDGMNRDNGHTPRDLFLAALESIMAGIRELYAESHDQQQANDLYQVFVNKCGWTQPDQAEFIDIVYQRIKTQLEANTGPDVDALSNKIALNLVKTYYTPQQNESEEMEELQGIQEITF